MHYIFSLLENVKFQLSSGYSQYLRTVLFMTFQSVFIRHKPLDQANCIRLRKIFVNKFNHFLLFITTEGCSIAVDAVTFGCIICNFKFNQEFVLLIFI